MKILLLGDSIRMCHGPIVEKYFKDKGFEFYQPEDNCRYSKYLLRMLYDYKDAFKDADIIHFNVGHWDLCQLFEDKETFSSLEEYKNNLRRITKMLLEITSNVIFATTTPVRPENPHNDNKIIDEFNRVAVEAMNEYGVMVNDLNALLRDDIYGNICDDLIHLSEQGKEKCAKQVIQFIEEEIKKH